MPNKLAKPDVPAKESFMHGGLKDATKLEERRSKKLQEWHDTHKKKIDDWNEKILISTR